MNSTIRVVLAPTESKKNVSRLQKKLEPFHSSNDTIAKSFPRGERATLFLLEAQTAWGKLLKKGVKKEELMVALSTIAHTSPAVRYVLSNIEKNGEEILTGFSNPHKTLLCLRNLADSLNALEGIAIQKMIDYIAKHKDNILTQPKINIRSFTKLWKEGKRAELDALINRASPPTYYGRNGGKEVIITKLSNEFGIEPAVLRTFKLGTLDKIEKSKVLRIIEDEHGFIEVLKKGYWRGQLTDYSIDSIIESICNCKLGDCQKISREQWEKAIDERPNAPKRCF